MSSTLQVDNEGSIGKGKVYDLPTLGNYAKDGSRGSDSALQPPAHNGFKGAVEYKRGTGCAVGARDLQHVARSSSMRPEWLHDPRIPTCHSTGPDEFKRAAKTSYAHLQMVLRDAEVGEIAGRVRCRRPQPRQGRVWSRVAPV